MLYFHGRLPSNFLLRHGACGPYTPLGTLDFVSRDLVLPLIQQ